MRILWAASSQPGSLFPAVPIVVELLRRGHQVTATADDPAAETSFRALGCDFLLEKRAAAVTPPARPMTRETKAAWWAEAAAGAFSDVVDAISVGRFDLVFGDALETGVQFAAEVTGVPSCSYVHWGMDECGPDVPFCFHLWDHEQPVNEAFAAWWNRLRASVGLPTDPRPVTQHRWYRTSPLRTLLLGLPELVYPKGELPAGVVRVGPTVWDPPVDAPLPSWVANLGRAKPAVLATLSTVGSPQDLEVVYGLAEATQQLDVDLIVTIPISHDLPALPEHVRVTAFLPHSALLPHVALFVNHAGNGAVNRAAYAGVPVLMLPTGRDQFQVAKGAAAASLGLTLQPDERGPEQLRTALIRLLDEPAYAETARQLAQTARRYHAAATAADELETLPVS